METIRPEPHRGDLVAAGAVPLAAAVGLLNVRLEGSWGHGVFLVLDAVVAALLVAMALLADPEAGPAPGSAGPARPRPYVGVLVLAGLALAFAAEIRLAQVLLGSGDGGSGTGVWVGLLFTLGVVALWRRRAIAVLVLVASVAGAGTVLFFVDWISGPNGVETFRWIGLLLIVVFGVLHLATRERRRRESVLFVVAAGLTAFALTYTLAVDLLTPFAGGSMGTRGGVPVGWALVSVAAGFGLAAFSAVEREPAPGYLGAFVLVTFVFVVGLPSGGGPSLIGWPLVLLVIGVTGVAFGLRPSRPLPPPPPGPAGETVDLPPRPAPPGPEV